MTLEYTLTILQLLLARWANIMMALAFLLPFILFYWPQTRLVAVFNLIVGALAVVVTNWLYERTGQLRLIGLPHLILWSPLAYYFLMLLWQGTLPKYARWIVMLTLATIIIALIFDYADVLRYYLGK
jgi:hypothetical protein